MMLLMMGSAEALPEAPATKTVFIEDMSDAQFAKAVSTKFENYSLVYLLTVYFGN